MWRLTRVIASDRRTRRARGPTSPICRAMARYSTKNTKPTNQKVRTNMDEELQKILKHLRLGGLLAQWDELLAVARRGRFSHERLLKHVLEAEYRTKTEQARLLRRKRAHIPELLEIETFPFARQPKLDRKRVMSLYERFDYLTKQRNIAWLGPTGCGKTGFATGLLAQGTRT